MAGAVIDAQQLDPQMNSPHPLVGTWKLLRYWTRYDQDPLFFPLGERAVGYITYTGEGFMSGTMQRGDVEPFAVGDRLQATAQEKARAFDASVTCCYCGRWEAKGDEVIHRVEASLMPDWIGDAQLRRAHWHRADRVDLFAEWQVGGRTRVAVVEWERAR